MLHPLPSIALAPVLPPVLRPWAPQLEPALHRLLIPGEVAADYAEARKSGDGARFAERLLDCAGIRFAVSGKDPERIPASGPTVLVANHPYGIVEGLVLAALLDRLRPDWKVVANSILAGIDELRSQMIFLNPFGSKPSRENRSPVRQSLEWLAGGGLLAMFPAGEVAHLDWKERAITDSPWKTTATRLALRSGAAVVPVLFEGANSMQFQLAGTIHPGLRTIGLAHEFHKLRGHTVRLRIGNPVPCSALKGCGDAQSATAYLRLRTFLLANRSSGVPLPAVPLQAAKRPGITASPASERLLSEEVASLPATCRLASQGGFSVYLASPPAIPRMLEEIGRCRELAFRQVGEGTGHTSDLDHFDSYYQHLFLWDEAGRCLAGAYRLAVTTDVLPRFGISGLYTSTLFRFKPAFFERLGPAVELGRSFLLPEYQKSYASLLLLWKGITRVVERRPDAPVLFGAVSISRDYRAASRGLIATYLRCRASHELSRLVKPRRPFRHAVLRDPLIRRFSELAADIEDLSLSIADIEQDDKGVPVLIRQYLRAGGRVLGFNIDPKFSDVLDALIATDLRTTPLPLLERCMGRAEARAFLARTSGRA